MVIFAIFCIILACLYYCFGQGKSRQLFPQQPTTNVVVHRKPVRKYKIRCKDKSEHSLSSKTGSTDTNRTSSRRELEVFIPEIAVSNLRELMVLESVRKLIRADNQIRISEPGLRDLYDSQEDLNLESATWKTASNHKLIGRRNDGTNEIRIRSMRDDFADGFFGIRTVWSRKNITNVYGINSHAISGPDHCDVDEGALNAAMIAAAGEIIQDYPEINVSHEGTDVSRNGIELKEDDDKEEKETDDAQGGEVDDHDELDIIH